MSEPVDMEYTWHDSLPMGTDLPWTHATEPVPTVNVATPRKCRRHEWTLMITHGPDGTLVEEWRQCYRCGAIRDESRVRRGRTNRARGNAIEREVAADLGVRRVGQYGGPEDAGAAADWITVQVKSGGAFSDRMWRWLNALPRTAGQLRAVVVTDAPGPGHRRRRMIVCELDEFRDWYGKPS